MSKVRSTGKTAARRGSASYAKGLQLEQDFAHWMRKKLGYREVRHRELVKGRVAERPYEVDLHGVRDDWRMRLLQWAGALLVGLSIVAFLGELPEVRQLMRDLLALVHPALTGFTLLIFGVLGFVLGQYGKRKTEIHAWVECKAYQTRVKREQVQKLLASVEDVNRLGDASWKPKQVIFVSATGFDADALNFARAYGVACYQRAEKGFERVL